MITEKKSTEAEEVKLTEDREVLIVHRNRFRKELLGSTLDLLRYKRVKEINPDFKKSTEVVENGKKKEVVETVDELIKTCTVNAENSKFYVDTIDKMLELDSNGKIETIWEGLLDLESEEDEIEHVKVDDDDEAKDGGEGKTEEQEENKE